MANTINDLKEHINATGTLRIGDLVSVDATLVEMAEFVDSLGDDWKLNLIRNTKRRYLGKGGVITDYAAYAKLGFVLAGGHQCALFSARKVDHTELIQLLEYVFMEQRDEAIDSEDRSFEDLLVLVPEDVARDFCLLRNEDELSEILENLLRSRYYLDIEGLFWEIVSSCSTETQGYLRLVAEEASVEWLPDVVADEEYRLLELEEWTKSLS